MNQKHHKAVKITLYAASILLIAGFCVSTFLATPFVGVPLMLVGLTLGLLATKIYLAVDLPNLKMTNTMRTPKNTNIHNKPVRKLSDVHIPYDVQDFLSRDISEKNKNLVRDHLIYLTMKYGDRFIDLLIEIHTVKPNTRINKEKFKLFQEFKKIQDGNHKNYKLDEVLGWLNEEDGKLVLNPIDGEGFDKDFQSKIMCSSNIALYFKINLEKLLDFIKHFDSKYEYDYAAEFAEKYGAKLKRLKEHYSKLYPLSKLPQDVKDFIINVSVGFLDDADSYFHVYMNLVNKYFPDGRLRKDLKGKYHSSFNIQILENCDCQYFTL